MTYKLCVPSAISFNCVEEAPQGSLLVASRTLASISVKFITTSKGQPGPETRSKSSLPFCTLRTADLMSYSWQMSGTSYYSISEGLTVKLDI